jgi:hypothetical protein
LVLDCRKIRGVCLSALHAQTFKCFGSNEEMMSYFLMGYLDRIDNYMASPNVNPIDSSGVPGKTNHVALLSRYGTVLNPPKWKTKPISPALSTSVRYSQRAIPQRRAQEVSQGVQ